MGSLQIIIGSLNVAFIEGKPITYKELYVLPPKSIALGEFCDCPLLFDWQNYLFCFPHFCYLLQDDSIGAIEKNFQYPLNVRLNNKNHATTFFINGVTLDIALSLWIILNLKTQDSKKIAFIIKLINSLDRPDIIKCSCENNRQIMNIFNNIFSAQARELLKLKMGIFEKTNVLIALIKTIDKFVQTHY